MKARSTLVIVMERPMRGLSDECLEAFFFITKVHVEFDDLCVLLRDRHVEIFDQLLHNLHVLSQILSGGFDVD